MDLHLKGKIAIVMGGSKGIGYAVAKGLTAEGVYVVLSARDETRLNHALCDLQDIGGGMVGLSVLHIKE